MSKGKATPFDVRQRIALDIGSGHGIDEVALRYGVSPSTAKRMARRQRNGESLRRKQQRGGAYPHLSDVDLGLVRRLVEERPTITVKQLIAEVAAAGGPHVAIGTMSNHLRKMGLVRTKLQAPMRPDPRAPSPTRYRRPAPMQASIGGRATYPSDLTDAQWALVEPLMPVQRPGGRPFGHSRRELLDAMLYVLRTGCAWRMLPHDFPPWSTVHFYFRIWRTDGLFERLNAVLRMKVRVQEGRQPVATAWVVDSQSTKTTEKGGSVDMMEESE